MGAGPSPPSVNGMTRVSVLARVVVLALLGVRAWLWTRDVWLGW